jgi:membrane-associated phospholipid phosphatase
MVSNKLKKVAKRVSSADVEVTGLFAPHRRDLPVRLLSKFSEIGDQPQLRAISGGMAVAGLVLGRGRLFSAGIRMLLAHELATGVKNLIKARVDRTRPHAARDRDQSRPRPGRKKAKKYTSFPSGHTAGSIAVAQAFACEFPEHETAALSVAGVVALAQIPRFAHYPSDVAAGAVIGAMTEKLLANAWGAIDRRYGTGADSIS